MINDKPLTASLSYKGPAIYDAGGDTTKQWFVYYSFYNPQTEKFQRFKVFRDINSHRLKGDRIEKARAIQQAMKELLEEGFNPFERYGPNTNSISTCIDIFLANTKEQTKPNTYRKFDYQLSLFKNWLSENQADQLPINQIKRTHIFEFLEHLRKERQWDSGKTYNDYKSNLSRVFNYFINNYDDVIEKNPCKKIESKPIVIKGNIPYNDNEFEEVRKLVLEEDPYLWIICQFVYYAAVRNEGEALNLRIKDIDLSSRQIIIGSEITKGKQRQVIPIYPEFMEVIESLELRKFPNDYFIFGRDDAPGPVRVGEDNFARRFRRIKKKLNLGSDYGIYSFKHTRACHMVDDGASLYEIQTLFRHNDLQATMKYLRSVGRIIGKKEFTKSRKI